MRILQLTSCRTQKCGSRILRTQSFGMADDSLRGCFVWKQRRRKKALRLDFLNRAELSAGLRFFFWLL